MLVYGLYCWLRVNSLPLWMVQKPQFTGIFFKKWLSTKAPQKALNNDGLPDLSILPKCEKIQNRKRLKVCRNIDARVFPSKSYSERYRKIHRKTPACNVKNASSQVVPVNFVKFFRMFLLNICKRLIWFCTYLFLLPAVSFFMHVCFSISGISFPVDCLTLIQPACVEPFRSLEQVTLKTFSRKFNPF